MEIEWILKVISIIYIRSLPQNGHMESSQQTWDEWKNELWILSFATN